MASLEVYDVEINGVKHQLQLSAEDAERLGDSVKKAPLQQAKAAGAQNKSGSAANKAAPGDK